MLDLSKLDIPDDEKDKLNEWAGFFSFQLTWLFKQFIHRPERTIGLFAGNRHGKSVSVAFSYVLRILGLHPIEAKNMRPDKACRIYRFSSKSLPVEAGGECGEGEVKNTQYPLFKKFLPASLIVDDITIRRPVISIKDPQGGKNIFVEFTSFGQSVGTKAGVERASIWIDESAPQEHYEEEVPRLMTTNGDMIITLTPAEFIGYEFDMIYDKASTYIRTPAIQNYIKKTYGKDVPLIEKTDSKESIAVLQAASDDNPIFQGLVDKLNKENNTNMTVDDYITGFIGTFDEETIAVRRYGLFRQTSGQIYKDFDTRTHIIPEDKYFPGGIPMSWGHARGIDYHERVNWACGFMAISPQNEVFIYDEFNPSPEKMITLEIARVLASKSKHYHYILSLTDPSAAKTQSNTGLTVAEDLNRAFYEFRRDGICSGGFFRSWDTKSTRGRDEIRKRLKNSRLVGKPFNNRTMKYGKEEYLPTIWIFSSCKESILSFKNWRMEEWGSREKELTADKKNVVQTRWSHFPDVYEAIFKESTFRPLTPPVESRGTWKEYGYSHY